LTIRGGAATCLAALLVPAVPSLVYVVAAAWLALLAGVLVEASRLRHVRFLAERDAVSVLSLGQPETLQLRIRATAVRPLWLTLRQPWPSLLEPPATLRRAILRAGESLALELPVRGMARGRERLGAVHVAAHHWGFVERSYRVEAASEVAVLPDLRSVGKLHAKLNRFALRGLGGRVSARVGKGRDFDRLREYRDGDDVRDVAWRATARRGKLIVREYRLDRSQDVVVCLDTGHRMEARVAGLTKLDHAVNAAVMLGYICNRMEDRTSYVSFATEVTYGVPAGRGSSHLRSLTAFASALQGAYVHTDYLGLAAELRRRLRRRSLIVILTALPEMEQAALLRALRMLAPQHLPLIVVFQDPDLRAAAGLLPADERELSRTLAARDIWGLRAKAAREARALGAMVVETDPGDAGVSAMNGYLEVKRRQLL
jgi:uncharacterized protein (DUF58 family)